MSHSYLKHLDFSLNNLCTSLGSLISSHLNINVNVQRKLQQIKLLVNNENHLGVNLNELESQLMHLHSMLDVKIKGADEVSVVCTKEFKNVIELNNEYTETLINGHHMNESESDIDSLSGDGKPIYRSKLLDNIIYEKNNSIEGINYNKKKLSNSFYSHKTGPQLRKKLCLNLKTKPLKNKSMMQFKSQNIFKANKDTSRLRTINNISRANGSDLKSFTYTKKCRRLSLMNSVYSKRNKTQPKRSSWDNDDSEVYCICKKPSYGGMIACDNENCKIEWFHYKCVDITTTPKGKWYCPFCKDC